MKSYPKPLKNSEGSLSNTKPHRRSGGDIGTGNCMSPGGFPFPGVVDIIGLVPEANIFAGFGDGQRMLESDKCEKPKPCFAKRNPPCLGMR